MHYKSVPYSATVWVPAKHATVIAKRMTKLAGGSTTTQGWGEWIADDGNLHGEPVSLVTGYFEDHFEAEKALGEVATMLLELGEHAVLVEFGISGRIQREVLSA